MTVVTSVLPQIRLVEVYHLLHSLVVIRNKAVSCLSFRANVYHDARARVSPTQDLYIRMGRMLAVLLLKSMFSRPRFVLSIGQSCPNGQS